MTTKSASTPQRFVARQRAIHGDYFKQNMPEQSGYKGSAYRLTPGDFTLNLMPEIREATRTYFDTKPAISWHPHCNHGLSSQVCCINFLMPLADRPDLLSIFVANALSIAPPEILPIEDRAGQERLIAFEWFADADYLNEGNKFGERTRGANATSCDAAIKFRHEGRIEYLLIEWKYTESYGSALKSGGNETRTKRYDAIFREPGFLRSDLNLPLSTFFWEPFYQLLRQQMMAFKMAQDPECDATRVRVLHISPAGNVALHAVTSTALRAIGADAFAVFRSLLAEPDNFIGLTTDAAFASLLGQYPLWADYVTLRYPDLVAGAPANTPSKEMTA